MYNNKMEDGFSFDLNKNIQGMEKNIEDSIGLQDLYKKISLGVLNKKEDIYFYDSILDTYNKGYINKEEMESLMETIRQRFLKMEGKPQ